MAIEIFGQSEGPEREAAEGLARSLASRIRPNDKVVIVVGAKCYGEKRQDIDLIVFANFASDFRLEPHEKPADFLGYQIYVSNFVLVIEVKDQSANLVRFPAGNSVEVCYQGNWSSATDQAFEEGISVFNFIKRHILISPFVHNAVWLRNISAIYLPRQVNNLIGSEVSGAAIFKLIGTLAHSKLSDQKNAAKPYLQIASAKKDALNNIEKSVEIFTKSLPATLLDRNRLERICAKAIKTQQYFEKLTEQLLIFRGRGGAGKTVRLLQMAKNMHDDRGWRVLFLTYNLALVADVKRLLALMGITQNPDERTIKIQTCDAFFFALLSTLGLSPEKRLDGAFPADYVLRKKEAHELLRTTTPAALRSDPLFTSRPDIYAWDLVLVDEGQDWPEIDKHLLFSIFGSNRVVVADGVDQFVRNEAKCEWSENVTPRQIVPLRKSLRLKSNLCRFVEAFAMKMGLEWDMEINNDVSGGSVILVKGKYTHEIHTTILARHAAAGNCNIDSLICVTGSAGAESSNFVQTLHGWGLEVWDGTDRDERDSFPTKLEQHRVVRYESSRGLEGWTVICLDASAFYDRQLNQLDITSLDMFADRKEEAKRFAARWCQIAFTRAIDTLVIQYTPQSTLALVLDQIAQKNSDFIEKYEN